MKNLTSGLQSLLLALCALLLSFNSFSGPLDSLQLLRANLYAITTDNGRVLLDGNITLYSNEFSNLVDYNDAWKMTNFGENFGIYRNNVTLAVEKRHRFETGDTTDFRMWNLQERSYQIEVTAQHCNLPNIKAFLLDKYTGRLNELNANGVTTVDFSVTDEEATRNEFRFSLVYRYSVSTTAPFSLTGMQLSEEGTGIKIHWDVNNESNIDRYLLEKSVDGLNFQAVATVIPKNWGLAAGYDFFDENPEGATTYRVLVIGFDNEMKFSKIEKLQEYKNSVISVFPNPVVSRRTQFSVKSGVIGLYTLMLFTENGVAVYKTSINTGAGDFNRILIFPETIQKGIYYLQVLGPDKLKQTKKILLY